MKFGEFCSVSTEVICLNPTLKRKAPSLFTHRDMQYGIVAGIYLRIFFDGPRRYCAEKVYNAQKVAHNDIIISAGDEIKMVPVKPDLHFNLMKSDRTLDIVVKNLTSMQSEGSYL